MARNGYKPTARIAEGNGVNIYQRLEARGWKRVSGTSRNDFYRKGKWMCIVPSSIAFEIKFVRVVK